MNSGNPKNIIAELVGMTKTAAAAIDNKPLVIRYFPYKIGRLSRKNPADTLDQDLLLPDIPSFSVSRHHVIIDRDKDALTITDAKSTCGTIVDDTFVGERFCAPQTVVLASGKHTLILGDRHSPFVFSIEVRELPTSDQAPPESNTSGAEDQVRVFYRELRLRVLDLLTQRSIRPHDRYSSAEAVARDLIARMVGQGEILRGLASNPLHDEKYIASHSVDMAIFGIDLFNNLRFGPDDIAEIAAAILLHDIGMFQIDQDLVMKPERFTEQEYAAVKQHTEIGREMLMGEDTGGMAAAMASEHHERIDGSGYPHGIKNIARANVYAGILDRYESLIHDRPYRAALTPHRAVRLILDQEKTAFDHETKKAFLDAFSIYPVSSIVRLTTGEIGKVVEINRAKPFSPQVQLMLYADGSRRGDGKRIDLSIEKNIRIVKDVDDRDMVVQYALPVA